MKRILYNNYVKFAAFILSALSVAFASYLLTTHFLKENIIYLFESSYEESYSAQSDITDEFLELSFELESTSDDNKKLHPEQMKNLPPADKWEYYIKVGDKIYSNVKNASYEDFENSVLSCGITTFGSGEGNYSSGAFYNFNTTMGYSSYVISDTSDKYEICIRMSDKMIEENSAVWNETMENANTAVTAVIILIALAAALFIYLLCTTGRVYGKEEIQLMLIDKMYVEINLFLLLIISIGGGLFTVLAAVYCLKVESVLIVNTLTAAGVFAVVSLSMLLILSLVRNLKNETFLKRSLTAKICRFLLKTVKRFFAWLHGALSDIKRSVLTVSAENFDGRFIGIIIIAYSAVIALLTVMTIKAPIFSVFLIAVTLGTVAFVSKRLIGFSNLKKGIEKIKNSDLDYKITDCPDGVIRQMAEDINSIGEGLQKSLEREVKAERMKSELITNVSHDLKTPLTSIINYADLLAKETLTPHEANDYAAIIKQKSERLKQLTNDLFDISKVHSGNEEFNIEDIDICLLINQAMAELDERIRKSGLEFRVKADNKSVFVKGDGKKLSRVFENLLINCVKYAMKNTRVYVDISETDGGASIEIKNIAGYEMNFDESEITERFVRGDSARSSEGSGLGLAIVKSYTEGCGGSVEIKKDGDLFKVTLRFMKA